MDNKPKMAKLSRALLSLTVEERSALLSSLPSPASPPIGSIASSEARPSPNKKECRCSSGESVVLDDRFITLRTFSCERLDAQLTEFRVLLIRSPPYTGKTSMAKLYAFYLAQKSASVLSINLLGLGDDLNNLDKHWKKQATGRSWQECFDSASSLTIIIDEIQILYPLNNSHAFWQNIKAIQQRASGDGRPQIRVLLFGPYGAPESAASISSATATPIELPRRLDLSFTWFDRTEYDEVMHSVDQATEEAHYMPIGPVAKEAIWSATRGHPGLVRRCLDHIYRDILPDLAMTETNADASTHIVRYLFSHAFFHIISNTRAAQRRVYTEKEKQFIEQLLAADENGVVCDDVPGELIRTGIIGHLDSNRVAFSAPLFRNVVINRLYASPSPPATQEDFDQFIRSCIQRMNPRTLQQSFSKSSTGLLYERQWQMEFYRAATSMVTAEHVISPDVGTVFGCKGLVDFYINGQLKWAVELLRDGDRADEHAKRFASTGRKPGIYHTMLAEMNRHALLDFRTADIPASEMKPDFWYIQYSNDYTQATVRRLDCPPDDLALMGHHVAPTST